MAASDIQNPPAPTESKSARKKKAKAERTESPAPAASTPEVAGSIAASESQNDSDNAYIRELQKSIRNVTKKITNTAKVDAIIAEHRNKSLDELITLKIINADQKAAHLKKPALQAQLFQFEEQLAQHKKIDQEHRVRLAEQEKALTEKFEKTKADTIAELTAKAEADANATLRANLLTLSQFLRLAAARRTEDADSSSDESMALEGVLLHIYSGDENAVATMLKLVQGADEQTRSTSGDALQTTFAQVKKAAIALAAPYTQSETAQQSADPEAAVESKQEPETDPTVANAGLTEVDEGSATALTNGHAAEASSSSAAPSAPPSNAEVADEAANAAGESQWDTGNELSTSQEWVDVKISREASETETGPAATSAAPSQSWADDHPETEAAPAAPADDGFQSVPGRNRGQREGGGNYRSRGGYRGEGRGRGGYRGEGRGRGRGGPRGGMPQRARRGGSIEA
ncbi:hypothetical protein F5144DRAFT_634038 [Chaetomium tenue]|uniref:Uncharacterized protein n=1 Tax=Chaetomium tenue TaxID=1854479 RepID=A0ACB7NXY8_9PEZI|nr:hypothetical protein F5144DRAFT_634038 [Chaetomium globosum]